MYGNYGFWSWLRYWYLDTENYVTWMLYDKGFYDYDYTRPKGKPRKRTADRGDEHWSDAKIASILERAIDPASGRRVSADAERIQSEIMADKRCKRREDVGIKPQNL